MADILGGDEFLGSSTGGSESSYVASLGRISGKLLRSDLLRNGNNLYFDTDLVSLEVTSRYVGINTDAPVTDLQIVGSTYTNKDLDSSGTVSSFDNVVFNSNGTVTSITGPIVIEPSGDAYIEYGKVFAADIEINDNYLQVTDLNTDMVLDASGTGLVSFLNNTYINGELSVSNEIRMDGNLIVDGQVIVGDSPLDTITVVPDFTQDIKPGSDNIYDFGKTGKRWAQVWFEGTPYATTYSITQLLISDEMRITGNTVSTYTSNDTLIIDSDTGLVQLERITIQDNTITNLDNTAISLGSTGTGYVKFNGTNATAIPVGNTAERGYTEVGETRWNTDLGYLECFDGTVYQVATGGGKVVTPAIMQELSEIYTLILG